MHGQIVKELCNNVTPIMISVLFYIKGTEKKDVQVFKRPFQC